MKKLGLILLSWAFLISCEVNEEITINQDGSGDYRYLFTLTNPMKSEIDSTQTEERTLTKDSVIYGKNLVKEIEEELSKGEYKKHKTKLQKLQKGIKDYTFNVKEYSNQDTELLAQTHFKDLNQLQDGNTLLMLTNKYTALDKIENRDSLLNEIPEKIKPSFKFSANQISRIGTQIDLSQKLMGGGSFEEIVAMGLIAKYNVTYHFPKRIKKSSLGKKAGYSLDGKTMKMSYNLFELIENPELLSFDVELED